jgi:hypothetical protein
MQKKSYRLSLFAKATKDRFVIRAVAQPSLESPVFKAF